MSGHLKYTELAIDHSNQPLAGLASKIAKSNDIISTLELVDRPISDAGIEKISSVNSKIENINNGVYDPSTIDREVRIIKRELDSFYVELKSSAIDGFLRNQDVIKLLSSKQSRDAALNNLQKQEELISDYTNKLEDATAKTSSRIEQVTTGLIASKIEDRVKELSKNPKDETDESLLQESALYWYRKRHNSLIVLGVFIAIVLMLQIFIAVSPLLGIFTESQMTIINDGIDINLLVTKAAIFALLYARYYFAQKNYRIYASLLAKYNHMLVNAKLLSGYMNVENKDPELYKNLVEKVTNLITAPVDDHHFKNTSDNDTPAAIVKNFTGEKLTGNS